MENTILNSLTTFPGRGKTVYTATCEITSDTSLLYLTSVVAPFKAVLIVTSEYYFLVILFFLQEKITIEDS